MKRNLIPTTTQKSFYGKAVIIDTIGAIQLRSYNTIVCEIDKATDTFVRMWRGYSATTMKHINAFRETYGYPKLSKKEWELL